ncbi:hypothetical protein NMG60_11035832 [Bertholletia excelsa]
MASSSGGVPPGFRFHPTDEELLHYYLKKKVTFQKFDMEVIREVDLNKIEPWDLQERCKIGSTPQNEWYFFSHKDRKYPTGSRTNRATNAGFWKATGRDKCIRNSFQKIGMRKTLVFYRGRAPHGQKTDWIMHEYRLEDGDNSESNSSEDGWVICRVFKKKNLFKVGSEGGGGGGSMGASSVSDHHHHQLMINNNASTSNNQPHRTFTSTGNSHEYLLRHQPPHPQTFDLYKSALALNYSYTHPTIPLPFSHIPHNLTLIPTALNNSKSLGYDYNPNPSRECESTGTGSDNLNLRYQPCGEPGGGLEDVGTCGSGNAREIDDEENNINEWGGMGMGMLDRFVPAAAAAAAPPPPPPQHLGLAQEDDSSNPQISLRGEMDFWGYAK